MAERNLDIKLGVQGEAQVQSAFQRVLHSAKLANLESRQSGELALERILKGGGAAAAITFSAEALKKTAEVLIEVRKGQLGVAEGFLKIGEAVPILGRVFEAGQAIRELITGEKEQIERIKEESKATDILTEIMKRSLETRKQIREDLEESTRKTFQGVALVGEKGAAAEQLKVQQENANKQIEIDKELAKRRQDAIEKSQKDIAELTKQRASRTRPEDSGFATSFFGGVFAASSNIEQEQAEFDKQTDTLNHKIATAHEQVLKTIEEAEAAAHKKRINAWIETAAKILGINEEIGEKKKKQDEEDEKDFEKFNDEFFKGVLKSEEDAGKRETELNKLRLDSLKEQADAGDMNAEIEAKRLETIIKFTERQKELQKILDSAESSPEEQAAAKALLDKLPGQANANFLRSIQSAFAGGQVQLPNLSDDRFSSGAKDRFIQEQGERDRTFQQQAIDLFKSMVDLLGQQNANTPQIFSLSPI
jgi:hypothetical protein